LAVNLGFDEEKAAVEDGRNQIKNGQWLSHEDANKQIDEWLKE
jgi:predicted transcriptional regulator